MVLMSALGQKQTSVHVRVMSGLPPKADIDRACRDVRFVPKTDNVHRTKAPPRASRSLLHTAVSDPSVS
jgi:hypothetical protein